MLKIKNKEFKEILIEAMDSGCLSNQSYNIAESILKSVEKLPDDANIAITRSNSSTFSPTEAAILAEHYADDLKDVTRTKQAIIKKAKKLSEEHNVAFKDLLLEIGHMDNDIILKKIASGELLDTKAGKDFAEKAKELAEYLTREGLADEIIHECSFPFNPADIKFEKAEPKDAPLSEHECNCEKCDGNCSCHSDESNESDESVALELEDFIPKEMDITMIHRDTAEKYIGKVPIVFLGTEDRSFGAGIAKFYADKYPKMRDRSCGNHTDYLSVFREQDLVEQKECCLDDIGQPVDNNIMFCALTPKADRYAKMNDDLFETSLRDLFKFLVENDIKEIAMPQIGSKREGMSWPHVESLIEDIGKEYGFLVCWIIKDND